MITTVSSYQASDGTVHRSLEEAKVHELCLLAGPDDTGTPADEATIIRLVKRAVEARQVLRKRERKPKVRKATRKGGKQAKTPEGAAETTAPVAA